MTRILSLLALCLSACADTPTPDPLTCDDAGAATAVATVETTDQGLGIEAIDTTITSCSSDDQVLYQDCCGTRVLRLEHLDAASGTWTQMPVASVCDCAFLDPVPLPAGEAITFPNDVRDPDLCTEGGGSYRLVYAVGPTGCTEEGCFVELVSNTWTDYCEG